jgi:hypothetical protein
MPAWHAPSRSRRERRLGAVANSGAGESSGAASGSLSRRRVPRRQVVVPDANPAAPAHHPVPRGAWPPAPLGSVTTASRKTVISQEPGGPGGIGGAPAALVGNRAERSVARPLAAATRSRVIDGAPPAAPVRAAAPAGGPGRRAVVPTAPQRGDRARLPHQVCSRSHTESSQRQLLMAAGGWRSEHDDYVQVLIITLQRLRACHSWGKWTPSWRRTSSMASMIRRVVAGGCSGDSVAPAFRQRAASAAS